MKSYFKDNNRYQVFNVDADNDCVHFLWGKFDFLLSFEKSDSTHSESTTHRNAYGEFFGVKQMEFLFKNRWFRYEKVVEHGFTFEETCWTAYGQEHYAEFPRDLLKIATEIAAEELKFQPLAVEIMI